jgi:hypothetical protein
MVLLSLTACGSNDASTTTNNNASTPVVVTSANANLRHSPSGTLQLSWDHTTHVLTVQVALTGLMPKSVHPAHIHAGSCQASGKVIYPLNNVVADSIGFANTITKINDVADGIPESGWSVNVHNGPDLTPAMQEMPIACANVTNNTKSTTASQAVQATLGTTNSADQSVSGTARLNVSNKQLTVVLSLQGMSPRSTHATAIHTGSCASQGNVVYQLKPVVADTSGSGSSTTVIPNVASIPQNGWYTIVHLTNDITKQTGNDPIACGDITPNH